MPYKRPGEFYYPSAGAAAEIQHGQPVLVDGVAGIAVKQKAASWNVGLAAADRIAVGERFGVIIKGIVEVNTVAGLAKGDAVYIAANGTLTEAATGATKFGRVHEVVGDGRGVRTGKVRVNLDAKDSF